ncbi:MAG: PLP-dependent aminotransferase family protein [Clostridiales bacterium]|nr:PLP-dependent aminotransferase family protein [Clostridiales bacterium]
MLTLTPVLNDSINIPLYIQLYTYIRDSILNRDIKPGEKLPSLRSLAKSLNLSLTTIELAYNQLLVEGYISSKPQSGYFVNDISSEVGKAFVFEDSEQKIEATEVPSIESMQQPIYYDPTNFDFFKWKKCINKVLNEYSHLLFEEGNPRGEAPLRYEISKYIYQSRGVRCSWEQVIVGAGTQQLLNLLCIILQKTGIDYVSFENPGYLPVRDIFKDRGFKMATVPLDKDGIKIELLPANIRSTVYVSPSNQFPTASVMPIARRYSLLDWAYNNDSIIIEDDYNSELIYSGRPVPSLQGLDTKGKVVYLGSFSSTLFSSIKISYMVLPNDLNELFEEVLGGYTQTCSKAEQLTLALYMQEGYYQTNLKKLRKIYSQKIQLATSLINKYGKDKINILANSSGLHMLLELKDNPDKKQTEMICAMAKEQGLMLAPVLNYHEDENRSVVVFYYTRIPLGKMEEAIVSLIQILTKI